MPLQEGGSPAFYTHATLAGGRAGRLMMMAECRGRDAIVGGRYSDIVGGGGWEVRQMLRRCTLDGRRL